MEVVAQDPLGGDSHLALLDPLAVLDQGRFEVRVLRLRRGTRGLERHSQVRAEHADHSGSLLGVAVGQALQRVHPAQTHRSLVRPELFDRFEVRPWISEWRMGSQGIVGVIHKEDRNLLA
jgi:hypothetical protein